MRILSDEEMISDALSSPLLAEGVTMDLVEQGRMGTLAKLIEKLVRSYRPGIAEPEYVVTIAIETIKGIGDPQRKAELARSLAEIATEKLPPRTLSPFAVKLIETLQDKDKLLLAQKIVERLPPRELAARIVGMVEAVPESDKLELALHALEKITWGKLAARIVGMMEAVPWYDRLKLALNALEMITLEKLTTARIVGMMEAVPDRGARRVLFYEASAKAPEMKIIVRLLKRLSLI